MQVDVPFDSMSLETIASLFAAEAAAKGVAWTPISGGGAAAAAAAGGGEADGMMACLMTI